MLFCCLTKTITPKIGWHRLVLINSVIFYFQHFMCLDLGSHTGGSLTSAPRMQATPHSQDLLTAAELASCRPCCVVPSEIDLRCLAGRDRSFHSSLSRRKFVCGYLPTVPTVMASVSVSRSHGYDLGLGEPGPP